MTVWQQECFEHYVNSHRLIVEDAGPLLSPIREFAVTRNEKLDLILDTRVSSAADNNRMHDYPVGTVRIRDEKVEFSGEGGILCSASGVAPFSQETTWSSERGEQTRERAKLQRLTVSVRKDIAGALTIDWLENLDSSGIWIGSFVEDLQKTTEERTLGAAEGVKLAGTTTNTRFNRALVMEIGGVKLYLGRSDKESSGRLKKPGYIFYFGCPDDATRKRIRDVLSFSLGNYLIYLGSTTLSEKSEVVELSAVSPPSIDRITEIATLPPAPLGDQYQNEVNQQILGSMANAIYAHYDELRFGTFSWAYWHAMCAPVHMAAVHFGGALEGLQNAYVHAHGAKFDKVLVADATWKPLKEKLLSAIAEAHLEATVCEILANKVKSNLNQSPSSAVREKMLSEIGVTLGSAETAAWKRRNLAAHGVVVDSESAVPTIRDTKLLRIILHRLILKITGARDCYVDDFTVGHAVRKVVDPVPV